MRKGYLTAKDLAEAVGCHVNTVHLYERWEFIPQAPIDPDNNYRMFSRYHLEQFKLAHLTLKYPYPGGKKVVLDLVYAARYHELEKALDLADQYREQFFEGVPQEVWEFEIGGYQVLHKWLKDRRGRELSFDEKEHYQQIVVALAETMRLMDEIDAAIPEWPII